MFGFCSHKYGKIEDGYQYCEKCCKAIKIPCSHKWEKYSNLTDKSGGRDKVVGNVLRCIHCGDMKNHYTWS